MLRTDYAQKKLYICSKEKEFRDILGKNSLDSFKTQAKEIAKFEETNGLSWTNDLDPTVTKAFQAVSETFFSRDLLKNIKDSLSASFIAKNWTEVLKSKIEKEETQLTLEEIVLFEKVSKVFKILLSHHTFAGNSEGISLNKRNMNYEASRMYEVGAQNLLHLCSAQKRNYSSLSLQKLQKMFAASRNEEGSAKQETTNDFLKDRCPNGSVRSAGFPKKN